MGMSFHCWFSPCAGNEEFTRPYLEGAKIPHNSQFAEDDWTPAEWNESAGGPEQVMAGFYRNGVVTRQYYRGDASVLEVGQGFMRLSGQEKRRVVRYIDDAFGLTTSSSSGAFLIVHAESGEKVGIYSPQEGLQLQ